jgi:hypothetical protein
MHHDRFIRTAFAVVALAVLARSAAAQQRPAAGSTTAQQRPAAGPASAPQSTADPWYGKMAKPKDFELPRQFGNVFTIELPKNWQFVSGHTNTVFVITEKTKHADPGGAITLEYMRKPAAFDPSLLSAVAPLELEDVQQRESAGSGFAVNSKMVDGRALIMIQYDRTGLFGALDHVVQYSFPVGQTMYHLICIAPKADIEKYRQIFAHAAASFTPTAPKGAGS